MYGNKKYGNTRLYAIIQCGRFNYGYNLFLEGCADGVDRQFVIAISEKQQQSGEYAIGDVMKGTAWTKLYPEREFADNKVNNGRQAMKKMQIKTERLLITQFDESMIASVHLNSLDEDTRKFVPDEVFETEKEAHDTVKFLINCYGGEDGPFVFPIITLANNENIGYVQAIPQDDSWEIGFKIAKKHTGNGYATEALKAFLPVIMDELKTPEIWGIAHVDNIASCAVLEKLNFKLQEEVVVEYHGSQQEVYKYLYCIAE